MIVVKEPLVVALPNDHRLVSKDTVALQDIAGEIFIGISNTALTLQVAIDQYLKRSGWFKWCVPHAAGGEPREITIAFGDPPAVIKT
jgi:hypothetical protein